MQRVLIGIWVVGALVIAATVIAVPLSTPKGEVKALECPRCGKTVGLQPTMPVRNCPRCKDEPIRMKPVYKDQTSMVARVMGPVLFEVNLLFGVYLVAFHFAQKRKHTVDEREYRRFNCPNCGQKLRYHMRRAGAAGQCPRCNELFSFPEDEPAEEEVERS